MSNRISMGARLSLVARAIIGLFSQAQARSMLAGILQSGPAPRRGTRELLDLYNMSPLLRMATDTRARRFASLDWHLYAPGSKKKDWRVSERLMVAKRGSPHQRSRLVKAMAEAGDLREISSHPVMEILYRPNPLMMGSEFRRIDSIYLDIVGESFWTLAANAAGVPSQAYPVPPSWVRALPIPARPYYEVSYSGWHENVPEEQMLFRRDLDPVNPYYRGTGMGRAAVDELSVDEMAAKHIASTLRNRARPDILIYGEDLGKDEQITMAEQKWLEKLQGYWRTGLPHFMNLPKDVKIQELGQDFRSTQMAQLRVAEKELILNLWGIPPEMQGITKDSNRATSDVADYLMDRNVTVPKAEGLREFLQVRLVDGYDERLIIDYDSPIRDDVERHLKAGAVFPGCLLMDEARAKMGEGPLPDGQGQVLVFPVNVRPIRPEQLGAMADSLMTSASPQEPETGESALATAD